MKNRFPEQRTSFDRYKPLSYASSDELTISRVEVVGLATTKEIIVRIPGLVCVGDDGYIRRLKQSSHSMAVYVSVIPKTNVDLSNPKTDGLFAIVVVELHERPNYWYFLLTQGDKYYPLKVTVEDNAPAIDVYSSSFPAMHDVANKHFEAMPRRRFGHAVIKRLESMTTADHSLIGSSIYRWLVGSK